MIRGKEIVEEIEIEIGRSKLCKKTILFVLDKLECYGGLETHVYGLGKELESRGHDVLLVCTKISPKIRELFKGLKIFESATVDQTKKLVKKHNVDLIHAQPFKSVKIALALHEETKVPFVVTWHGVYYTDDFPKIVQKAAKIICVSEETFNFILSRYPLAESKMTIIQNGVDVYKFTPVDDFKQLNEITFISRQGRDRLEGIKCLIEAFLKSSFCLLTIIGFDNVGLSNDVINCQDPRIRFVGEVENIEEYIKSSSLVVATGRGVREALACGKPCIVMSNWGYDGIVRPSDFRKMEYANFSGRGISQPLSSSIILDDLNLLTSSELRYKLGKYGRLLTEQFYDIRMIADKIEVVYKNAIDNNKLPTVSVLLPVYNHANIISQCLKTLLNQTFRDFEIIIINDGSKDGLRKTISAFCDKRIRYFQREENLGLPKTLNEALRYSRGKYITWTSADNVHEPMYLERLVTTLEASPESGSVYSDYVQVDINGNEIQKMSKGKYLFNGKVNFGPSFLYRFEAANRAGFFDETLFGTEDRDYSIRIAAVAPVTWLPEILYKYTIHDQSLTGKYVNKVLDLTPAIQGISKKWKHLILASETEPEITDKKSIVYGKKVILPVISDCTVNSNLNTNLDGDPIFIGRFNQVVYRHFVETNFSDFSEDIRILRAEFEFFCIRNDNESVQEIGLYQVLEPWQEKLIHWNSKPAISDKLIAKSSTGDIYRWMKFDVTGLVQKWIDSSIPNYGVCFRLCDETEGKLVAGFNRHNPNMAGRPRMIIEYTGKRRFLPC